MTTSAVAHQGRFCHCDHVVFGFCHCRPQALTPVGLPALFDPAPLRALFPDGQAMAATLRINGPTHARIRSGLPLTAAQADRYAVRAGYHPAQIWSTWVRRQPHAAMS